MLSIFFVLGLQVSKAGPPFNTDDPQPVDFRHWEYYISTINNFQAGTWSGTMPHFEVNYGLVPNVQVHMLAPINYDYTQIQGAKFGYANTEVGVKFRFIQETKNLPQVGIFPLVEVPTIKNPDFSNGKAQIYLPVWVQKSWGKLTTYGGVGYWINPGTNNRNWIFSGWEVQYDFSKVVTLGGELFHSSAAIANSKSSTAFNLGGIINASDKTHFIFSVGHSLTSDNITTSYLGILWTI